MKRYKDSFGYTWQIRLWRRWGLHILLTTSGIDLKAGVSVIWSKDCRYINLTILQLDFTLFFDVDEDWA